MHEKEEEKKIIMLIYAHVVRHEKIPMFSKRAKS